MRKRLFLAILMVAVLILGTACTASKDTAADAKTVVIEVAGTTYTKEQVDNATQYVFVPTCPTYTARNGMTFDATDTATLAAAQEQGIQLLVQNAVLKQKIHEQGFDVFTDAEKADLQKTAEQTYQSYVDLREKRPVCRYDPHRRRAYQGDCRQDD